MRRKSVTAFEMTAKRSGTCSSALRSLGTETRTVTARILWMDFWNSCMEAKRILSRKRGKADVKLSIILKHVSVR